MGCGYPATLLDVQYRMHPDISLFPNATFYESMYPICECNAYIQYGVSDKLQDDESVRRSEYGAQWRLGKEPLTYIFFDIHGHEERYKYSLSSFNVQEVNAILFLVSLLYNCLVFYPLMRG